MPIVVDTLLAPTKAEPPCGPDPRHNLQWLSVQSRAEGAPPDDEQERKDWKEGKEPAWAKVRDGCLKVFEASKDLRVALYLTLALLKLEGIQGLADGLGLMSGLVGRYWAEMHPRMEDGDPTARANIVASLAAPMATYGDQLRFAERVMQARIVDSKAGGRFTLMDVKIVAGVLPPPTGSDAASAPTAASIEAAFREADPAAVSAALASAETALKNAEELDKAFSSAAGTGKSPDLGPLRSLLKELVGEIKSRMSGKPDAGPVPPNPDDPRPRPIPTEGEISSREQIRLLFQKIYRYYEREEPSSPVPMMMKACEKMVGRRFVDISRLISAAEVSLLEKLGSDEAPKQ